MIFAARRATTARPRRMRPPPCSGAPGEAWKQRDIYCSRASGRWGPGDWGGVGVGGQRTELKVVLRARRAKGSSGRIGCAPGERRVCVASRVCVDCVVHLSISMELEENALDGDTAVKRW